MPQDTKEKIPLLLHQEPFNLQGWVEVTSHSCGIEERTSIKILNDAVNDDFI